jgi:hypothetical protein
MSPSKSTLESSFDIICSLSPQLALRILREMGVKEVVRAVLVSVFANTVLFHRHRCRERNGVEWNFD